MASLLIGVGVVWKFSPTVLIYYHCLRILGGLLNMITGVEDELTMTILIRSFLFVCVRTGTMVCFR